MSRNRAKQDAAGGKRRHRHRDAGMNLPEILVSVVVSGMLVASMAAATSVVLRQGDNTQGRLNNSRSEQAAGTWMPSDLASAEIVDDTPGALPCGTGGMAPCPAGINVSGTNTLMLTWTSSTPGDLTAIKTTTKVSYRYVTNGPDEYEVIRVECVSSAASELTCTQITVLHNALAPPTGTEYYPGVTKPLWVMLVTLAVDPVAPGDGTDLGLSANGSTIDPTYYYREGRRVSVTINGGGDKAGAGGGQDQITLTAGGTRRDAALSTTNLTAAPTFAATRSRCGGNFGLLVDTSGSIGTNISYVRSGLTAFINAFAGTPIKLQVVPFSTNATTAGAGTGWTRYFDMLIDADVAELKTLVTALNSGGLTNWEDALFRMFRNNDGSVQQVLPDTLIFFTDGMPTYNRLNSTSSTGSPAVTYTDDTGLPTAGSSGSYNQLSWNRANRIARVYEADLEKFIGVFVGTDVTGSSTWLEQGPGYHLTNYLRGYHETWEKGYHLSNVQHGYHTLYQYAGTGLTYEYVTSGLTYQYAATGMTYEYAATGLRFERKISGNWTVVTPAVYFAGNTSTGTGDSYRVTVTGALSNWTAINATVATAKSQYDKTNTVVGETDGFRPRVTGTLGTWTTSSTKALFDLTNTTADANDGYRVVVGTLGTSWNSMTKALYDTNNALAGQTDGFRARVSGTLGTWTTTTAAYYALNNTVDGTTDGYNFSKSYTAPFDTWEAATDAAYLAGNTTADNTDGWDAITSYTAPFTLWESTTQAAYNSNNVASASPADSDGWRVTRAYTTPYSAWETTTESAYTTSNTVWGNTDGWDATKAYSEPFTFHEGYTSVSRKNTQILKDVVAPGGVVPAQKSGTTYTNSKEATYYELPTWDQFAGAMTSMALAECGGTVTLQTKIGTANAPDPFTYQSSVDKTTATTSAQFHSGTFDFDLAGGGSQTVTISPFSTSDLTHYNPVGWSCKAGGASYPFTTALVEGGPWSSITLTVSPNQAISCVYSVVLK